MLFLGLLVLLVVCYLLRGTLLLVAYLMRPYWPEGVAIFIVALVLGWLLR